MILHKCAYWLLTWQRWENGKTKQLSGSAEIHARFDSSVFIKEEMYLKKHFTSVNNRRDVERLMWCTVLWERLFPIYDIWRKRLCSPSVEHVYKPSFLLWSQCICVTMRAEVKGLHMIISLGAVASRSTLVLVQHSTAGLSQWIHFIDDHINVFWDQFVLNPLLNEPKIVIKATPKK